MTKRAKTEERDEGVRVVGVRIGPRGCDLDQKLARLVAAAQRATPGQRVSEGGVLRGLLQEAPEP